MRADGSMDPPVCTRCGAPVGQTRTQFCDECGAPVGLAPVGERPHDSSDREITSWLRTLSVLEG